MSIPQEFADFWSAALRVTQRLEAGRFYEAFALGDSAEMAGYLAGLVLEGTKRATASLAWTYQSNGKPRPKPGDLSILMSWSRRPLCILETTAVDVVAFMEVPAEFALLEGEGDKTLSTWRRNHEVFFARECARIGRSPSPSMPIVCEHFSVVYQVPGAAP
ncbi:ASCH domain-containing protein [Ramlibacter monticola]|uniref:ASCH domain-containing protein n=1 Tax=Ramlibacter monticola TaxID=1926872 RepID=A0A936Z1C7_9BURK|nr:ASCH domain-containing protein [Ramlibacter monticola]MBL0392517.1 ASCH domain-containing protein [Ramlibacter monticola]